MSAGAGESIASVLARIRVAWHRPDRAPIVARRVGAHDSTVPGGRGVLVRVHAETTLRDVLRHARQAGVVPPPDAREKRSADALGALRTLSEHAGALEAADTHGRALEILSRVASELEDLTSDPSRTVLIGPCPRVEEGGSSCGHPVRASADATVIACPRCGHMGTRAHWRRALDAPAELVTADELCRALVHLGIRLTPVGIRVRVHRGQLSPAEARDGKGRALFDPERVMREMLAHAAGDA